MKKAANLPIPESSVAPEVDEDQVYDMLMQVGDVFFFFRNLEKFHCMKTLKNMPLSNNILEHLLLLNNL